MLQGHWFFFFIRRVFIFFFFHKFRSRPSKKKKKEVAEGVLPLDEAEFENEEAALEAALAVPDPDAPAADSAEATAPKKPKRWENLYNFLNIRINFFSWYHMVYASHFHTPTSIADTLFFVYI